MPAMVLVFAFVVVPVLELWVLWQIGSAIGILPTIGLLLADSVLGAALMRWQGRTAWQRFGGALAEGRVPAKEVIDGVLVVFGGALLLTPGFLTDVLGLALLAPPTRAVVRRVLVRRYSERLIASAAAGGPGATRVFTFGGGPPPRRGRPGDDVVEGTATEIRPRRGDAR